MRQLNTQCQATALAQSAGRRIEDYTVDGINPIDLPPVKAVLDLNNLVAQGDVVSWLRGRFAGLLAPRNC